MIVPVVAGLALAALLVQRQSLERLKLEAASLREQRESGPSGDKGPLGGSAAAAARPPSWEEVAKRGHDLPLSQRYAYLLALAEMSPEELVAAMDEIKALDLPAEERASLLRDVISALAEEAPALVLENLVAEIREDPQALAHPLEVAFAGWLEQDPAAAVAWLDRHIAEGDFESRRLDGRHNLRFAFEAHVAAVELENDAGSAASRLAGIHAGQRLDFLRKVGGIIGPAAAVAYAALVRDHHPESEHHAALSLPVGNLVKHGGLDALDRYLAAAGRTQDLRDDLIAAAAEAKFDRFRGVTLPSAAEAREFLDWAGNAGASDPARLLGRVLARQTEIGRLDFTAAAELVVSSFQPGREGLLDTLLESRAAGRPENLTQVERLEALLPQDEKPVDAR